MDLGLVRCGTFPSADLARDAWAGLSHFQNIGVLADRICALHNLPAKSRQFALKQAAQIRYAMMQAREYARAAAEVSLATKPVLLYYSAMSLGLAELLFKNNGDSRLEKLREEHNCHGLQLSLAGGSALLVDSKFQDIASQVMAKPQYGASGPKGTFEVWHRTSREAPLVGAIVRTFPELGSQQSHFGVLLGPENFRPEPLPRSGITLLDCLQQLPGMADALSHHDIALQLVRAKCSTLTPNASLATSDSEIQIMIHPSSPENFVAFCSQVKVSARWADMLQIQELPGNSARLTFNMKDRTSFGVIDVEDGRAGFILPWSIATNQETVYFSTRQQSLNEFGLYYVSLHMLGNLARYYPDKWLAHIESHSPLAAITETLIDLAAERMPFLLLSELRREYLIATR